MSFQNMGWIVLQRWYMYWYRYVSVDIFYFKENMEFSENSMDDGFSDQYPDVVAIFPPEDGELDLTQFPPIIYAQEDLSRLPSGSREEEVNVVIDDEVNDQVS